MERRATSHDEPLTEALPLAATGPRRRPSGEPPPLPRPVSISTRVYLALGAVVVVLTVALTTVPGTRQITAMDLAVSRALARVRWDPVTRVCETLVSLGSLTTFRILAWATLAVLLVSRRFQHLFVALGLLLVVPVVAADLSERVARMRPAGVTIIGEWHGYAYPSRAVTEIALVLTIGVGLLAPPGVWRRPAAGAAVVFITLVVVARLYVAVDHPTDAAAGLVLGAALPAVALRLLTPEETFPVTYRRGARAHLEVDGRRGAAIRGAVSRQLGVDVVSVEPFALGASAGSTPLCLTTRSDGKLFAKLYAANHVRSDRWYKLGRTIRYGRLEDERPFNSVRRLVQYEDHMLRVLRDAGVPTAQPLGIVEITPEREYVLVAELIADAVELDRAEVTDDVADQALDIVRKLWDAGLAHRDIKPGNLLLSHGKVYLIDAAFAEIRPTPWRSAVDLANMMLTLSLRMPAEQVYHRALRLFSDDEIAEAFAASRSVTVPSQLRRLLRAAPDDATATFCALAPPRAPVAIQRWSLRRLGLTAAVALAAIVATALFVANLRLAGLL
jgi:tRNA A-37 threonylcarbamoyl transferase component Bud32/membrane-associated phospholipid phosphatase